MKGTVVQLQGGILEGVHGRSGGKNQKKSLEEFRYLQILHRLKNKLPNKSVQKILIPGKVFVITYFLSFYRSNPELY